MILRIERDCFVCENVLYLILTTIYVFRCECGGGGPKSSCRKKIKANKNTILSNQFKSVNFVVKNTAILSEHFFIFNKHSNFICKGSQI